MRRWNKRAAAWASAFSIGCAGPPTASRVAPCWDEWPLAAAEEASAAFAYDATGKANRYVELERYTDYLHGYCLAVNAAIGQGPVVERAEPWWKRWARWFRKTFGGGM